MLRPRLLQLFLRLPDFRGKVRLEGILKRFLYPNEEIKLSGSISMALDPREWLQRDLLANGGLEPLTIRLFEKLLKPGDVYIDVGSHVGYHTLIARTLVGESGKVVAVDPQPYNCEKLLANWRVNGFDNVVVYVAGIGKSSDWVSLRDQPATDRSKLSLLESSTEARGPEFAVPVFQLETLWSRAKISRAALLKIDTEGYEAEVLLGGKPVLPTVANIILEILPENRQNAELVARLLLHEGMTLYTVEGNAWTPGAKLPENNLWATRRPATE
jgi:FkbM family methyltransferase